MNTVPRKKTDTIEKAQFKAYITKYVFSHGIIVQTVEETGHPGIVKLVGGMGQYYHGVEWYRELADAQAHAKKMVDRKVASLKKKLAVLIVWSKNSVPVRDLTAEALRKRKLDA